MRKCQPRRTEQTLKPIDENSVKLINRACAHADKAKWRNYASEELIAIKRIMGGETEAIECPKWRTQFHTSQQEHVDRKVPREDTETLRGFERVAEREWQSWKIN